MILSILMRFREDKVFNRLRLLQYSIMMTKMSVFVRRVRMVQVVMKVPCGCFADAFMICVPHYLNDGRN